MSKELREIWRAGRVTTVDAATAWRAMSNVLNYIAGLEEGAWIRNTETDCTEVSSLHSAVAYLERAPHPASS